MVRRARPAVGPVGAIVIGVIALGTLVAGARPLAAAPCSDANKVRASAEALVALGPRPDSSQSASEAVELIAARLTNLGLEVKRDTIGSINVPRIAVGPWQIQPERMAKSTSENVWARIGGDGPARLLIAHYDTVPGSPGAVDNAASVGILLEIAGCLVKERPPGPVIIGFTGGEEVGLVGARRLALTLRDQLELVISLDLVGHQAALALNGIGSAWGGKRLGWLAKRVEAAGADASVPLLHRLVSRKFPQLERSDHGAFTSSKVPSVHLYGRGDDRIYLPYHTAFDVMTNVTDEALENALGLTYELAVAHDGLPRSTGDAAMWIASPLGPFVVSGFIVLAVEIVLAIAAFVLVMLCWARRRQAIRERAVGVLGVFIIFVLAFVLVGVANLVVSIVHPTPFGAAHAPLRFSLASLGIAAALGGLMTMAVNSRAYFIRDTRYHSYASFITLFVGVALLGTGATEIAWQPLLASVLFAVAGFVLNRAIVCSAVTVLAVAVSVAPLVAPAFLREAIFHGFYPPALPLAGYLALISLPSWLAGFGAVRARLETPDRRVTIAVGALLVLLIGGGVALLVVPEPPCSETEMLRHGLACEVPEIVGRAP